LIQKVVRVIVVSYLRTAIASVLVLSQHVGLSVLIVSISIIPLPLELVLDQGMNLNLKKFILGAATTKGLGGFDLIYRLIPIFIDCCHIHPNSVNLVLHEIFWISNGLAKYVHPIVMSIFMCVDHAGCKKV